MVLNIDGTFADLGLALALISSSIRDVSSNLNKMLVVGEVGLTGEVRPVAFCDRIVNEGYKMGFENIVVPLRNKEKIEIKEANVIGVSSLSEAINKVF